jgi:hypothetical protein
MGFMSFNNDETSALIFDQDLNICGLWLHECMKDLFEDTKEIQNLFLSGIGQYKTSSKIKKEINNGNFTILENTTNLPKPKGGIFIMVGDAISPLDKNFYLIGVNVKKWWEFWK